MISYIICSTPRSGSNLLGAGLSQTGLCGHPREYFNPRYIPTFSRQWGVKQEMGEYLARFRREAATSNGALGLKLHGSHLRALPGLFGRTRADASPAFLEELFPNPRYIYLRRANQIRQAVSFSIAARTEVWMHRKGEPAPPPPSVGYDFRHIDTGLRDIRLQDEAWREFFGRFSIRPVEVLFERLAADYAGTIRRVLREAGVETPPDFTPTERFERMSDHRNFGWELRYRAELPFRRLARKAGGFARRLRE